MIRCAGCGFTHDRCESQREAERLLRLFYNALQCGNQVLIDQAKEAVEKWLD